MDDGKMFGRRWSGPHKRRCDFCHKAVNNGYVVNDPEFRGFFCGAPHANIAYKDMVETAKDEDMKLENE